MAFLHVFRVYVCCLLVMSLSTMNVWIILTLGLGSGVGYLLIRPLIFYLVHKHRTNNGTNNTTWTVISPEPLSSTPKSFSIPRLTMSRDLMEALRERRISKSLLSGTVGSADVSLQWDFTGNVTEDLEPNNWIRQSQWDGSLEMLDTGYVGGDSPDCSAVSFTMYVSVVWYQWYQSPCISPKCDISVISVIIYKSVVWYQWYQSPCISPKCDISVISVLHHIRSVISITIYSQCTCICNISHPVSLGWYQSPCVCSVIVCLWFDISHHERVRSETTRLKLPLCVLSVMYQC